jgi:hypothetical protein
MLDEGRFTGSVPTHEGDPVALADVEIHPVQRRVTIAVMVYKRADFEEMSHTLLDFAFNGRAWKQAHH